MFRPNRHLDHARWAGRAGLILLAVAVLALAAGGDAARAALRYDRAGLAGGEWWRLAGAHLVHLGWRHAVLDLAGLAAIAWLLGGLLGPGRWLLVGLASAAAVDAGLWWWAPGIDWYVGLSGVLHGAIAAAGVALIRERASGGWLLLAVVILKLAVEQWLGPLWLTAEAAGGPVVVDAHLFGALGGALAAILAGSGRPTAIIPG